MIASSIVAAPSPQHRLKLLHRNRSILTDSSDEAEAYSAPSQPAPCYPEITMRVKTPSSCQIPTREIPLLTLSRKGCYFKSVGVLL